MRPLHWLLIPGLLLICPSAHALEFFGDLLYWQATEPIDWALNTNRSPIDQTVAFETLSYNYAPGFRVGAAFKRDWDFKLYYTRFYTEANDSTAGYVTPLFLSSRFAVPTKQDPPFFESGTIHAAVDYNVFDLDLSKSFDIAQSWQLQPVLGLRGAWIDQSFEDQFQGTWSDTITQRSVSEHIRNNFWGIGPKIGLENSLNLFQADDCKLDLAMNFYTAYLIGFWNINDVATTVTDTYNSQTRVTTQTESTRVIPIAPRDFGAMTFQAMIGLHLQYRRWDATAGYEFNQWLNQCQFFDDATGPHNNDLILQGLTVRIACRF